MVTMNRFSLTRFGWTGLMTMPCAVFQTDAGDRRLKESFNPKAVSKLMGHAKEIITMDVYADNRGIITDAV